MKKEAGQRLLEPTAGLPGCVRAVPRSCAGRKSRFSSTRRILAIFAFPVVMLSCPASAADAVPKLDVTASCAAAASMVSESRAGPPEARRRECFDDEQSAHEQLAKAWTHFAPTDRASCLAAVKIGGEPTYTQLTTCLEMAQEVAEGKQEESLR